MERPLLLLIRVGLMLVLLVPLLVAQEPLPSTFFPYIVGKALYARTLIEIVFGLWIILITAYPAYRPPRSWIVATFAILLLGSLVAALAGVSVTRSLWSNYERMQGVVDLLHWFGFVLVAASTLRSFVSWRMFLNANVAVSVVVAIMGITQSFDVRLLPHLLDRDRIDITLGNPVYVGAYMLVALTTALALLAQSFERSGVVATPASGSRARRRRRRRQSGWEGQADARWLWRAFWTTAVILDFVVLLMAGARGALIGLAVALGTVSIVFIVQSVIAAKNEGSIQDASRYLFNRSPDWRKAGSELRYFSLAGLRHLTAGPNWWLKSGAVLGLLLIVAVVFTLGLARDSAFVQRLAQENRMVAQLASFGTGEDSTNTRLNSTKMGLVAFAQRPLVGWGPENFAVAYDRNVGAERFSFQNESYDQAHNKVVEELTTKGLVGFVPFAAMWLLVAWTYIKTLRRRDLRSEHFTLLMGAATLGYFVQNLFLFDTPATALQIYLLLGFAIALEVNLQRDPELLGEVSPAAEPSPRSDAEEVAPTDMQWLERFGCGEKVIIAGKWMKHLWKMPEFHIPVVLALVVLAVVFLNVRAFDDSRLVGTALVGNITFEERIDRFERGINAFPVLGNQPRLTLFNHLASEFPSLTPEQRQIAVNFASHELEAARRAEPQEWRVYVRAAFFLLTAANWDPSLLELSRELVDEAARLAPERVEIYDALASQFVMEGDFVRAQAILDEYLEMNPESSFLLQIRINQVSSALAQSVAPQSPSEGLQPVTSASNSVQNQRSPTVTSTNTEP